MNINDLFEVCNMSSCKAAVESFSVNPYRTISILSLSTASIIFMNIFLAIYYGMLKHQVKSVKDSEANNL